MNPLNSLIDHTLLKPEATIKQIQQLCEEARKHQFASVCVNPVWVERCASLLEDSPVKIATVIGFPLGATTIEVKAFEANQAVTNGADEVDMVMNIGALKSGDLELVKNDIKAVVEATAGRAIVKVILETGLLSNEEITKSCKLAVEAGAHFVKTSTGFGPGGATAEHVQLMRNTVGADVGVKASGGVRDHDTAQAMVNAGATRIGTSSGIAIVTGKTGQGQY